MKIRSAPVIWGGFIVFVFVSALALYTAYHVERQLSMKAAQALNTWAFRDVSYDVHGDTIVLAGELKDQDLINRAEREAVSVFGANRVKNLMLVKPNPVDLPDETQLPDGTPIEKINFIVKKRNNMIYLNGFVGSTSEKMFINGALSEFRVVNDLEVRPLPKRWNKKIFDLVRIIKKFERVTLSIQDRSIHMSGTAHLGERIDLIQSYMQRVFPKSTIDAQLEFEGLGLNRSQCQDNIDVILSSNADVFAHQSDRMNDFNKTFFDELANTMMGCEKVSFGVISSEADDDKINSKRAELIKEELTARGLNPVTVLIENDTKAHLNDTHQTPQIIINVN